MKAIRILAGLLLLFPLIVSCEDYNVCPDGTSKELNDLITDPAKGAALFVHFEEAAYDQYLTILEFPRVCSRGIFFWDTDLVFAKVNGYLFCTLAVYSSTDSGWVTYKGIRHSNADQEITSYQIMMPAGKGDGTTTIKVRYEVNFIHQPDEPEARERFKAAFRQMGISASWVEL
jgi:hypothetical protein